MMKRRTWVALTVAIVIGWRLTAAAQPGTAEKGAIRTDDLKGWLSYLSSDELGGRGNFSEGLGVAAEYIADHLREWGVKPGGDHGSYFQRVAVLGIKNTGTARVTVEMNGQSRTFTLGQGIELPKNMGVKRTFTADQVEFVGYGLLIPGAGIDDYKGRAVKGKVAVWLGAQGPKGLDATKYRRNLFGRARTATEDQGALAVIGPVLPRPSFGGGGAPQAARPGAPAAAAAPRPGVPGAGPAGGMPVAAQDQPDFTTVQRLDRAVAPAVTADDAFLEYLFSGSDTKYADLKAKAAAQEPLPGFTLKGVRITFALEPDYKVARTQYTRNVVGIVEGTDPALRSTYVAFGAHYDHLGYAEGEVVDTPAGPRRQGAPGRVHDGALPDRIWNGADDDGSGTVALMAIARAFQQGPRPKRSLLFVWHTGEERGLWGSRYYADYPTVPIESIVAQLNADMIGRNQNDKAEEANTVYLIGSDRISTELHQISEAADKALPKPLTLDYAYNDPADPESLYTRSDHYSYASKGIPIIFYTTGMHPDYHYNTDDVSHIEWAKMTRIVDLIYETGLEVANLDHAPARDNKGPRAGKPAKH